MSRKKTPKSTPDTPATPTSPERLIRQREVTQRITLSRPTLWRMVRDGDFPAPIQLTPTRIAWREAEVDAWIAQRALRRA